MLLIINAKVLTPGRFIENGAVCINGELIADVGDGTALKKKYPQAKILDAAGGIVMPGLTNCHTHLYSTFARGMCLKGAPPKNFVEILKKLWWRLDKALTKEDVYYSALPALIECVKAGTTTIVDHHASPSFVKGSLATIRSALKEIPIRSLLSYEVSDRDGERVAEQGIEENIPLLCKEGLGEVDCSLPPPAPPYKGGENLVRHLFGLHASFTLSDKTLKKCADVAHKYDLGFHVHTAEDKADRKNAVMRFKKFGILGPKTILAHCVHISEKEMDVIARTKTNVVHNPSSNLNNKVGMANIPLMLKKKINVGLGTDGMRADMFEESKFAHLVTAGFDGAGKLLLENNAKILANYFEKPLGKIEKGAYADIIILDYAPPTPLTYENSLGHFLYGMRSQMVSTTIVGGKILMKDRKLVGVDEDGILKEARSRAKKLWGRL